MNITDLPDFPAIRQIQGAQDIEFLRQLYFLLREKKYSIEGAKTYLKNNKEKAEKDIAVLNSLKNIKQFLVSLKESL